MQKFVESVSIDPRLFKKVEVDKPLLEKISSIAGLGKFTEALVPGRIAWEVPISKYDEENANGRIYPKALWERVINEQRNQWFGSPMLTDHPSNDSDGSPEKICGVWLEARVGGDGYVYGKFVPSGSLGRDLEEHLQNGLRAGTSSSGFGELLSDGKTVDPSSYMIERLSDWVLTPSQGTYFTYEASTNEAKNASDSRFGESAHNQEHVVQESKGMATKLTKLEEKKFRKDMQSFLEDAQKITDPQARLREFEEILSFFEEGAAPDLREAVTAKIDEQKKLIAEMIEDAANLQNDLGVEDTEDLKEKLAILAQEAALLKEEGQDWEKVATTLQEKLKETQAELNARPTPAYVEHLKSKIAKLYAERKNLEKKITENIAQQKANLQKKEKVLEAIDAEIGEYKNKIAETEKRVATLEAQVGRLQSRNRQLQEAAEALADEYESYKALKESRPKIDNPADAIKKYTGFREDVTVESYWADLALRHGADIKPFESRLRSAKTLREAQMIYMKILPLLNESVDVNNARIPESVSMGKKERVEKLEQVGVKLGVSEMTDRLPEGWV